MSIEYWDEVEAIFSEAVEAGADRQAAVLEARCSGRPAVRAEVESLLASHFTAGDLITPMTVSPGPSAPGGSEPGVGDMIGPFRLVEWIGAGGMGTVYRAERADGSFAQRVAIKLIAGSLAHPDAARRFRAERQILASLTHPNIVSLLDGRVTPDGQAYLVMEAVDGTPITQFCQAHALSLAARLELFRQVCAAVHYAHRYFVVHRDLKPANVLVTPDGAAKVLDFGVAKLVDPNAAGVNVTLPGLWPGPLTPNYASPEQLRGLPVTTSSDIYALGVMLYELLTGATPYDTTGKPLDEVVRLVVNDEPRRPSAAAASGEARLPYQPARALKGDLDAIVLRAMRKAPEGRYASAEALSDDIARHLNGQPVEAREPSLGYVARKLAARHTPVVTAIAAALVLIVAALVAAVWEARIAVRERARAEQRFEDVRRLTQALLFKIHDEVTPLPGSTPVRRTIVAEALGYLERLSADAADHPRLQLDLARAYARVGRVQGHPQTANLGDRAGAIVSFRKAQTLLRPLIAPAAAPAVAAPAEVLIEFVEATQALSQTLVVDGQRSEAAEAAREAVQTARVLNARNPSDPVGRRVLASANFTAALAAGYPGSLPYWQEAGALFGALLSEAPGDPRRQRNVALVEKYLGGYYELDGDYGTSLVHHLRASELDERRLAANPADRLAQFDVAIDLSSVAGAYDSTGNRAKAIESYERSLAVRQKLADSDPRDVLARSKLAFVHAQLGRVFRDAGQRSAARAHLNTALEIYESLNLKDAVHRMDHAEGLRLLGGLEADSFRRSAACEAYAKAVALLHSVTDADRHARFGNADPLPSLERAAACTT